MSPPIVDARPEAADPRPTMIEIGADNIPGFDEQLIGLSAGDEKTFTLTYPDDYPEEDLAGEEAEFTVNVNEVHEKRSRRWTTNWRRSSPTASSRRWTRCAAELQDGHGKVAAARSAERGREQAD